MPMICSSVKRLRFIRWSSQTGHSLLQNGLFQRGKVTGNVAGGRLADANIRIALAATDALMGFGTLALVLWGVHIGVAFSFTALWGFAFGMAAVVLPTNLSRAAPDALEAAGSLMVTSFQVAITIGALAGGYIVDTYGATGPLTLTAMLAASTVVLALLQPRS
jgi:DHA1 family purine ribonucleoside efflux pump-like MFS transporter